MSRNMEAILLEEASEAIHREMGRNDKINKEFSINKYFSFMQSVYLKYEVELGVNSSFFYKTISELADAVESDTQNTLPKLLTLQEGDRSKPLIIFAGGANCFLALKRLMEGMEYEGVIYGMCATVFERPRSRPATVADEIESCCEALREQGVRGPFSLIGYSIGGIFALELARRLRETGAEIRFLALIDTLHNEHTWPWRVWFRHFLNRTKRKIRELGVRFLARKSRQRAVKNPQAVQGHRRSLDRRLKRFFFRYCDPTSDYYPELAPEWCESHTPAYKRVGGQLLRMRGQYTPTIYRGELIYYRAGGGATTFREQRRIWSCYLPNAEWVDWQGNHLSIVVGRNGLQLGKDIGRRLLAPAETVEQVA